MSHLESATDDDLDRLLSIVVDVENLFICVHREEDPDTKQASDHVEGRGGKMPGDWRTFLLKLPQEHRLYFPLQEEESSAKVT